ERGRERCVRGQHVERAALDGRGRGRRVGLELGEELLAEPRERRPGFRERGGLAACGLDRAPEGDERLGELAPRAGARLRDELREGRERGVVRGKAGLVRELPARLERALVALARAEPRRERRERRGDARRLAHLDEARGNDR